jgi:serine/threonine protein kinase
MDTIEGNATTAGHPQAIGRYRVTRALGRGAMGMIYEGTDGRPGQRVAIKTLRSEDLQPSEIGEAIARFRREAQAGQRLRHPNIVAVHEHGEQGSIAFIVMEYADGEDLKQVLARRRLTLQEAYEVMKQVLVALDYSHRHGVVHRDIKPANVMVRPGPRIQVMDFGIARIDSSSLTQAGTVVGTPTHMAPEQLVALPVDARADLWACGVILYEMLTGVNPFEAATAASVMHRVLQADVAPPSRVDPKVSVAWDGVMRKALARKPDERFQSAREFHRATWEALNAGG